MDKEYVVIVDSMADFEIGFSDPNVVVINTPVTIGGEDFTDATPDEFYDKQKEIFAKNANLRKIKHTPIRIKTDAPRMYDIKEAMEKILQSGKDAIYVATASSLTGAFNQGKAAVQIIEEENEFENYAIVIDGLSMSALTAVLVRTALRVCDTTDEFVRFIMDRRFDTEHYFIVEEFEAFRDSGRIKPATLALAATARIKPLMRFDFKENVEKREPFYAKKHIFVRTLFMEAAKTMRDTIDGNYSMLIHAMNPESAEIFRECVIKLIPTAIVRTGDEYRMGPATGVHLGYTATGLAFLRKKGLYPEVEERRKAAMRNPEFSIYGYDFA